MDGRAPETPAPPRGAAVPVASAAREAFPNGLRQPEGGYRFSLDPLLLAAFVRPKKNVRMADLGTGCGVAALAALLLNHAPREALGLDIDPAMTRAATDNAALLGLSGRFTARTADVARIRDALPPESFGLALANPPYRKLGTGLACQEEPRTKARFEALGSLLDFLSAASWLLGNRGSLAVVFPAERLSELMSGCESVRLAPKRLRLVHSRLEEPARLALLEAVKNAGTGLSAEAPLVLYEGRGAATRLCEAALSFCPFLAGTP